MEYDRCINCGEEIHVPDDRTGLIHTNGLYVCWMRNEKGKLRKMDTVAETE